MLPARSVHVANFRGVIISTVLGASVFGQSFNVDIGNYAGTPSAEYAARGLPGAWNTICFSGSSRYHLVRLHGTASDVVVDEYSYNPCAEYPFQEEDDYALFGDGVQVTDVVASWALRGLENGTYTVVAYVLEPGSLTGVGVCVGASCMPTEFVQTGANFVERRATVTDGILRISAVGGIAWTGEIYGFQLILQDCNHNGTTDALDVSSGESADCNQNGVPDECEMDCDHNGIHDPYEPSFVDCNLNRLNDICELDCNNSGQPDDCDVADGTSRDVDGNGVPDECQRVLLVPIDYETIQAALDAARTGDTVLVADGTYVGPGNRDLDFRGKGVTLHSEHGPSRCILDASASGRGVLFDDGEPPTAVVDGFTITNGNADYGGAIACVNLSKPTIRDCIIRANNAYRGGGIYCTYASPLIDRCMIVENQASIGGGISQRAQGDIVLSNCLVANNHASRWAGVMEVYGSFSIANCTLTGNTAGENSGIYVHSSGRLVIRNSVVWGNALPEVPYAPEGRADFSDIRGGWLAAGSNNLDLDPLFVNPENGDYRLSAASPCLDQGDPAYFPPSNTTDLDGHARVLCGRVDIGAYEFGFGDYDCDQTVTLDDFSFFPACMTGPNDGASADAPYPLGCEAFDADADLDVDLQDFAGFLGAYVPAEP